MNQEYLGSHVRNFALQHAAAPLCKISSSVMTPTGSLNLGRMQAEHKDAGCWKTEHLDLD